jgi:hypothetical protein
MTFKGTLNGQVFAAYVEQCLAPMPSPGDIVVMDNVSSHKVKGAIDPILAEVSTVLYLPLLFARLQSDRIIMIENEIHAWKTKGKNS